MIESHLSKKSRQGRQRRRRHDVDGQPRARHRRCPAHQRMDSRRRHRRGARGTCLVGSRRQALETGNRTAQRKSARPVNARLGSLARPHSRAALPSGLLSGELARVEKQMSLSRAPSFGFALICSLPLLAAVAGADAGDDIVDNCLTDAEKRERLRLLVPEHQAQAAIQVRPGEPITEVGDSQRSPRPVSDNRAYSSSGFQFGSTNFIVPASFRSRMPHRL